MYCARRNGGDAAEASEPVRAAGPNPFASAAHDVRRVRFEPRAAHLQRQRLGLVARRGSTPPHCFVDHLDHLAQQRQPHLTRRPEEGRAALPLMSRGALGIWRGSYEASCTGGRAKRRARISHVVTPSSTPKRGGRAADVWSPRESDAEKKNLQSSLCCNRL